MYSQIVPYNINEFSKIYVAGVHFYFTLYLIEEKISFAAFEDAYGMLCKGDMLYRNLKKTFPVHADLAQQYGLFDMSSPYIDSVICATQPTNKFFNTKPVILFNLYNVFFSLPFLKRHLIIRFFVKKKIHLQDNAVLILTQHFYNLGVMSKEQQLSVYTLICNNLFNNKKIYIKKHPDDNLQYDKLGKNITTIDSIFPSELLPIISNTKSLDLFTISSTGLSLIKNYFRSCTSLKEDFPTLYDESNEYDSILKILKILTEREYK